MANYRLNHEAKLDLVRIHQYGVRQFGIEQADKYFYAFFEQFERIADQPYLFPLCHDIRQGYRRCICGVDAIYYRTQSGQVEIMAVVGRQNTDDWL